MRHETQLAGWEALAIILQRTADLSSFVNKTRDSSAQAGADGGE